MNLSDATDRRHSLKLWRVLPLVLAAGLAVLVYWSVRQAVYWNPGTRDVPRLIELLKGLHDLQAEDRHYELLRELYPKEVQALIKVGKPAVPAVVDLLNDDHRAVRARAANALGLIGPPAGEAAPKLADALTDRDDVVRLAACRALWRLGPDGNEAVPELVQVVTQEESADDDGNSTHPSVLSYFYHREQVPEQSCSLDLWARAEAAYAIANTGPAAEAAVPPLIEALDHDHPRIRQYAVLTLGMIARALISLPNSSRQAVTSALSRTASSDPDHNVRACAVHAASMSTGVWLENREVLIGRLKDAAPEVRGRAAGCIRGLSCDARVALADLTEALDDEDPLVRREAAGTLAYIFDISDGRICDRLPPSLARSAVPALGRALQDEDAEVRADAAAALEHCGAEAKDAVPALVKALDTLESYPRETRLSVVRALGNVGPDARAAVPGLIKAFRGGLREEVARTLGRIGPDARTAAAVLRTALEDESSRLRAEAAAACQLITGKDEVAIWTELLKDSDYKVRIHALYRLRDHVSRSETAASALIHALDDSSREVRQAAARCFYHSEPIGDTAIPALIEALEASDRQLRITAANALTLRARQTQTGRLGPKVTAAVPRLTRALNSWQAEVRLAAVMMLGKIGPDAKPAIPALVDAVGDTRPAESVHGPVGFWAAEALSNMGNDAKVAVPALRDALGSRDPSIRLGAAVGLSRMGCEAEDVGSAFATTLKDGFHFRSLEIRGWLTSAGEPAVILAAQALSHDDWEIRKSAAELLRDIGPKAKSAVPALTAALRDENQYETVRVAALRALWRIDPQAAIGQLEYGKGPQPQ